MNAVELSLFAHRLAAICDEMGATLKRTALSPNIKDREDYSCALFDADGELVAQAAHIPVHLGSMAFCMRDIVARFDWQAGDIVVFNDPFLGGTHLPDITVVIPVFHHQQLIAFAAARAHHTDVGGKSAGSMGVHSKLEDEGIVISPRHWFEAGIESAALDSFLSHARNPAERRGDLSAQRAACQTAAKRLAELQCKQTGISLTDAFAALLHSSESYGTAAIAALTDGSYSFSDVIEDDGLGSGPLEIRVNLNIQGCEVVADFGGTAPQSAGPLNCPLSVTAAAVFYVFRCLMARHTPQTAAIFRPITLLAPEGCLVNARPGAAVAAGNVETSQRIVDVVLGALAQAAPARIPAAAQGTMNNVVFGADDWVYYETVAGGMGAHASGAGLSAVQCHMTNTKNSSIEVLEMHYPLRIEQYSIRQDSGGAGEYRGGSGLSRQWLVLKPCSLSLLTERRSRAPYGLSGGEQGSCGRNRLKRDGIWQELPSKCSLSLQSDDVICIDTPGGGGFGATVATEPE